MTTNPAIKLVSYLLYTFIVLHAIQGLLLWRYNRKSRGSERYAVKTTANSGFAARNMGPLGTVILLFILLHLWQFWFQMKTGQLEIVNYDGVAAKDLYAIVDVAFGQWYFVAFYVFCMVAIGFHLWHGFQSSFQTLGLNHRKYTPVIKFLGKVYSVVIPAAFALIPVYFFIMKLNA